MSVILTKILRCYLVQMDLLKRWICYRCLKDTHREKGPSNKTPALTENTNMDIWVVSTSNQIFFKMFLNWNKVLKKLK